MLQGFRCASASRKTPPNRTLKTLPKAPAPRTPWQGVSEMMRLLGFRARV